jgi:Domain of unknown function (DUF6285)
VSSARPNRIELLEALQEHLEQELSPRLSGGDAYQVRIAINLLCILQRELQYGPRFEVRERQRLVSLLHDEGALEQLNVELSERIRSRRMNWADAALRAHLRQTVLERLQIDNPNYSAYRRTGESPGADTGSMA